MANKLFLNRIVREKNIFRFMTDWTENNDSPQGYWGYIDWHQTQKNSTDIYENKRYVIALDWYGRHGN
jgi:ribosomal-protein-alanine N-acetyltransferase